MAAGSRHCNKAPPPGAGGKLLRFLPARHYAPMAAATLSDAPLRQISQPTNPTGRMVHCPHPVLAHPFRGLKTVHETLAVEHP